MDRKRKLVTKEFEEEAVRLVRTSGRTKRETAAGMVWGVQRIMNNDGRSGDAPPACWFPKGAWTK